MRAGASAVAGASLLAAIIACAGSRGAAATTTDVGAGLAHGLAEADSLIEAAIGTRAAGAVLVVARGGVVIHERAFGRAQSTDDDGRPLARPLAMRTSTIFDLASVTKVMATTFAIMLLVDRGEVDLEAPLRRYLPEFRGPRLDSIVVRHLLEHSAGLVQWQPLYYRAATPAEAYDAIRQMPLAGGVGTERRYSDPGFMLLGYLVERVSGQPLDAFVERELYRPLGLRSTTFAPRRRGMSGFAATELGNGYERRMVYDSNFGYRFTGDPASWNGWRTSVLVGEVNDGNAWYAHGGVAGHAGLFSTAAELRELLDLLLARGVVRGRRYLSTEVVDRFLERGAFGHPLGWMTPAGMPEGSFAHGGFTGTYVLGVPRHRLSIVLLTNRQHVGADERGYFPDLGPLTRAVTAAIVRGSGADAATHPHRPGTVNVH